MPGTDRHRLGDWVLRADRGATGRANSAWPVGRPTGSVAEAVDEIERWYIKRGLRAGFQLFDGSSDELVSQLDRRDYAHFPGALVMTAALDDLELPRQQITPSPRHVVAAPNPSEAFSTLVNDPARTSEMTSTALPQQFLTIEDSAGQTLGGGRATLDETWVGFFAMNTVAAARRTGVALVVLGELAAWARHRGASRAWLQVMHDNTAARSLYSRVGLSEVHEYHYRFLTP